MTHEEITQLARDWIALRYSRIRDKETEPGGGYSDESQRLWLAYEAANELLETQPGEAWKLILAIHQLDRSPMIDAILSAGLIEDLLAQHGENFIQRVEAEARSDPSFAFTLGGVWKSSMTDEVWSRVQAVWDRRGWDGIPPAEEAG